MSSNSGFNFTSGATPIQYSSAEGVYTSTFESSFNRSTHILTPIADFGTARIGSGEPNYFGLSYDNQLAKSSYKPDASDADWRHRLEVSLARVCLLALENDRLHSLT